MRGRFSTAIGTALGVLVLDLLSKEALTRFLSPHESVEILPGFFNLVYVGNRGAAFGLLNFQEPGWQTWLLVGASLLAMAVIFYLLKTETWGGGAFVSGLGLVLGGAAGNLADRLGDGVVVDFLDFYVGEYHWPAFNVADSAITVGAVIVAGAYILQGGKRSRRETS